MDNRYGAPKLFVKLYTYGILAVATIRKNRKGWDKQVMNLQKSSARGSTLVKYDHVNKLLAVQWNDSKVVSVLSSLGVYGSVSVRRRVGREIKTFQTEKCVVEYQKNMGGVDRGDQIRERGGGFGKGISPKKWFKSIMLGMMDFGCLNSFIAWNMNAERSASHNELTYFEFMLCLAEEFMSYSETDDNDISSSDRDKDEDENTNQVSNPIIAEEYHCYGHKYCKETCPPKNDNKRKIVCQVCLLEKGIRKKLQLTDTRGQGSEKSRSHLVKCKTCEHEVWLHNKVAPCERKIFEMPEFQGLTCFEIYHHEKTIDLWGKKSVTQNAEQKRSNPSPSHEVYQQIREMYGLPRQIERTRKVNENNQGDENNQEQGVEYDSVEDDSNGGGRASTPTVEEDLSARRQPLDPPEEFTTIPSHTNLSQL